MENLIKSILYPDSVFLVLVTLFVGVLAATFLGSFIGSFYFLIKGWKIEKEKDRYLKKVVIYFILFILFEIVLFIIGKNYPLRPYKPEGIIILPMVYIPPVAINPIKVMFSSTLFGLMVYGILQIPYSIFMYIKYFITKRKDIEKRGSRALCRLGVLLLLYILSVVLFSLF